VPFDTQTAAHVAIDLLRAFGLGQLDDATAAVVAAHVEHCPECCQEAADVSGDDFLERLRGAKRARNTPLPAWPAESLRDTSLKETRRASPPSNISVPTESFARLAPGKQDGGVVRCVPPELQNNSQYEIIRKLGAGGMGVVYLAKNKLMDRLEVLKVISSSLVQREGVVERFLREIRAAAALSHDNIVKAYSAMQLGDLLVFAMEYVQGEDLAKIVKKQGPLPIVNACHYARQVALGLEHAFERDMVHRDIKPHNLIVARAGKKRTVKILDFGLAKATSEKKLDRELTGEGKMLGTPAYMAPEQGLDASTADTRADIYSLGCTLYYLLTGSAPFKAASLAGLLLAHQTDEAKSLSLVRPEVPTELAALVARMMAKDPGKRFQQPVEVAQALMPFLTKSPGKECAAPPVVPARRLFIRRPLPALALCIAVIGFALWAAGVFWVKTAQGIIVVKAHEPNLDIFVDGEKITVTWGEGGKHAEICAEAGRRYVEAKKGEFRVSGEVVTVEEGERVVFTAGLEKNVLPSFDGKDQDGFRPLFNRKEGKKPAAAEGPNLAIASVLRGHDAPIKHILFTPDDLRIVSASNSNHNRVQGSTNVNDPGNDNTIRVWNIDSGGEIRKFFVNEGTGYGPQGIAISPDGRYVAACTSWEWGRSYTQPRVFVWDTYDGTRKYIPSFQAIERCEQ